MFKDIGYTNSIESEMKMLAKLKGRQDDLFIINYGSFLTRKKDGNASVCEQSTDDASSNNQQKQCIKI